jgi:hypothetical protein
VTGSGSLLTDLLLVFKIDSADHTFARSSSSEARLLEAGRSLALLLLLLPSLLLPGSVLVPTNKGLRLLPAGPASPDRVEAAADPLRLVTAPSAAAADLDLLRLAGTSKRPSLGPAAAAVDKSLLSVASVLRGRPLLRTTVSEVPAAWSDSAGAPGAALAAAGKGAKCSRRLQLARVCCCTHTPWPGHAALPIPRSSMAPGA